MLWTFVIDANYLKDLNTYKIAVTLGVISIDSLNIFESDNEKNWNRISKLVQKFLIYRLIHKFVCFNKHNNYMKKLKK